MFKRNIISTAYFVKEETRLTKRGCVILYKHRKIEYQHGMKDYDLN